MSETATNGAGHVAGPTAARPPTTDPASATAPAPRRSGLAPAVGAVVVGHHLTTALDPSDRDHTLQSAATAVALLGLARRAGLSWEDLGMTAAQTRRGLRLGGLGAAVIAGVLAGATLLPAARERIAEGATAPERTGSTARIALVDIPVNAIMEEVAFRGVLPLALAASRRDVGAGVSTILFGLWHVLPLLAGSGSTAELPVGRVAEVAGTVVATTAAGAVFEASRARSDSLLAPVLLHGSLNVGAFLAGRLAARRGRA